MRHYRFLSPRVVKKPTLNTHQQLLEQLKKPTNKTGP